MTPTGNKVEALTIQVHKYTSLKGSGNFVLEP